MDEYPKEIIENASPLVFAVDAILAPPSSSEDDMEDLPFAIQAQRSAAFDSFYKLMVSKKGDMTAPVPSEKKVDDPLFLSGSSGDGTWGYLRKKYIANQSSNEFFEYVNVVPVSHRHSFPPSKDPDGSYNRISKINNALYALKRTSSDTTLSSILAKDPIQGILAEGWIEKHSHALPSATVIITLVDLSTSTLYEQARLEQYLKSVLENIVESSAKKRDAPILLLVLLKQKGAVESPKEMTIETERLNSLRTTCRLAHSHILSVHCHEVKDQIVYSDSDFLRAEKTIQDASMLYYSSQARRYKRKYSSLHYDQFVDLLPVAARYCIKIAMFYEFQSWSDQEKWQKCLKYWMEAYQHIQHYYDYLQGQYKGNHSMIATSVASDTRESIPPSTIPDSKTSTSLDFEKSKSNESSEYYDEARSLDAYSADEIKELYLTRTNEKKVEVAPKSVMSSHSIGEGIASSTPNASKEYEENTNQVNAVSSNFLDETLIRKAQREEIVTHSHDMLNQCRAVADWVNIKLMTLAFVSDLKTSQDFKDVVDQMRNHAAIYLKSVKECSILCQTWDSTFSLFKCIARQRFAIAQFFEKYFSTTGDISFSDIRMTSYFDTSNYYVTAGDAYAQYVSFLSKERNNTEIRRLAPSDKKHRFVGGLVDQDMTKVLKDELKHSHLALALECFSRALDMKIARKTRHENLSIVRIRFSMAMIHIQTENYSAALEHLLHSLNLVKSFPFLKSAIHHVLWKLNQYFPDIDMPSVKASAFNVLMDSRINTLLSPRSIKQFKAFVFSGVEETLKERSWSLEDETGKPIYFSLTFPDNPYCFEGDRIPCVLHLYSTLPFAVYLSEIGVSTSIGSVELMVQYDKMLLQPLSTQKITGLLHFKNLCSENIDPTMLDNPFFQGGKNYTSGLTASGVGLLYSNTSKESIPGGFYVSCVGLTTAICTDISARSDQYILLKLPTAEHSSHRYIRGEENFLSSCWSRPHVFSIDFGPRCMRVLNTKSGVEITDLTSKATNGMLLEGTVNRVLLRIKTGKMERCANVHISVEGSSFYKTDPSNEFATSYPKQHMNEPSILPVLVRPFSGDDTCESILPGWVLACEIDGCHFKGELDIVTDFIDEDTEVFTFFDIYRPFNTDDNTVDSICFTDFTVNLSYKKISVLQQDYDGTVIAHQYHGSIQWCRPIDLLFDLASMDNLCTPSGIRHPSNAVSSENRSRDKMALVNGQSVALSCTMFSKTQNTNLGVEVKRVLFEKILTSDCEVDLSQQSRVSESGTVIYMPKCSELSNTLSNGSKLKIGVEVKPRMIFQDVSSPRMTSISLGIFKIEFRPLSIRNEYCALSCNGNDIHHSYIGPLPIDNLPSYKREGPRCYIEDSPFDTKIELLPTFLKVGVPFEIYYTIRNKTNSHQAVKLSIVESEDVSHGLLVSGLISAEFILDCFEEKLIPYSFLSTSVGMVSLPVLSILSLRNDTWIVRGSGESSVYISP